MTGDRIHPLIDVSSFRHFSFPVTFFHPFPLDSSLINLRRHPRNDSVIHFFIHFLFIHLWSNVFHRGLQECKWKEMCNPWDSSVYLPWHLFNLWNQHVINYSEGSSILCFVSISNRSHVVTGTLFIIHSLWLLTLLIGIAFPGGLMDSINHPFNVKIRNQRLNVSISFWMTSFIFWCNVQESEAVRPWAPFLLSCSSSTTPFLFQVWTVGHGLLLIGPPNGFCGLLPLGFTHAGA